MRQELLRASKFPPYKLNFTFLQVYLANTTCNLACGELGPDLFCLSRIRILFCVFIIVKDGLMDAVVGLV